MKPHGQQFSMVGCALLASMATAGIMAGAAVAGCSESAVATTGPTAPRAADSVRSTAIIHESCEPSGRRVVKTDVNGDGKTDITKVFEGSQELCRFSDLNRDGKPDLYQYFDSAGQLRRREADFDDNGVMNLIEIFEGGKLVRRELDTTNQGRIDTWDTFDPATGKIVKRERDATSDGRIDQWWTFEGDRVTIAMDRNGDGEPDPEATVTVGGAPPDPGVAPPPPTAAPTTAPSGPTLDQPDAGPKSKRR